MDASTLLKDARIVPVVVIEDADAAEPLGRTLAESGLRFVEVTLRTAAALAAIERIAARVPEAIVGAGSIRRPEQFRQARDAGARFGVSPGFSERLIEEARARDLPFVPGAVTAGEAVRLGEQGYSLMKFFPAELAGGIDMLKALGGPLPEARFFPTGGISAARAPDYLRLPNVLCLGGTWIAPAERLAAHDFAAIAALARDAAALAAD